LAARGIAAGHFLRSSGFVSRVSVAQPSLEVGLVDSERAASAAEPDRGQIVGRDHPVDGLLGDCEADGDLASGQQPSLI
jgi:hypothetical protein